MEKNQSMRFSSINGYMASTMWIIANLIQLFTLQFCRRYWNRTNDPSGGMFDQMSRAARSTTANIAEGLGRHQTSRETEMRLLDVARASLSELYSDYYFILLDGGYALWPRDSVNSQNFDTIKLQAPTYRNDWPTESIEYIRIQAQHFEGWCCNQQHEIAINSIMILIARLQMMIETKMNSLLNEFRSDGGFTEALTQERLQSRMLQSEASGAPQCPNCGKPMIRRMIRKGSRQGEQFWGCSDYPRCNGTRPFK